MIIVSYTYDFEVIAEYRRAYEEHGDIVLPRHDEFVNIDNTLYRVETITHSFSVIGNDTEQQIIIKLTRQLPRRNI